MLGSGRLRKRVIQEGSGEKPKSGDEVRVELELRFQDKQVLEPHELTFSVGEGETVQALDLAMTLSQEGEKGELLTDPELAYG